MSASPTLLSFSTSPSISLPNVAYALKLTEGVPDAVMSSAVAPEKSTPNTMGAKEVSTDAGNT